MSGIEQLNECLALVLTKLEGIEQRLAAPAVEAKPEDMTRPLTALELCESWHVAAASAKLQLLYLSRKCRAWGLRPLSGGRGWNALYGRADVLHAESFAGGKIKRRRHGRAARGMTKSEIRMTNAEVVA